MRNILESLKNRQNRETTNKNYLAIWRQFNNFVIKLDKRPESWEDRASLFGAYLVERGVQSQTLKSYISAIKRILLDDGYTWNNDKMLLNTLTKACKMVNDRVKIRLPIQIGLLEMMLFEIQRAYGKQPYLESMYKAFFILSYYGMFRVGELATGDHALKACDVHIGQNKKKMLFILYSSKTHGKEALPQKIKITANANNILHKRHFCPFKVSREYLAIRGNYKNETDPFFVFSNNEPVTPSQVREVLRTTLSSLTLNPLMYDCHSFRFGRTSDMVLMNYSLTEVRLAGRWRSNVVYKYIKK